MADKIVVMHDGRVEQIGAPLELFDRPANLFVAGFIGSPSMNRLKGVVTNGGHSIDVGGAMLPVPSGMSLAEGRQVVFGIRPEHFDLADDGVEVQIILMEPTGSETLVYTHAGKTEIAALFRERHQFEPGATIRIKPRERHIHIFDAASGKRI
jgi:multiple sugar transport system ATP-binding protein